jgi:hypothetical protein
MPEGAEPLSDPRCRGCLPDWGIQPSSDIYTKLMNSLFALEVGIRNQKIDRLDAGFVAMKSVISYLNSDPLCVRLGLTRLLGSVVQGVHDTSQGAKPPLFFDRKVRSKGGPPTHTVEGVLRAQLVLMLRVLTHGGMTGNEAGTWIASALKKASIRQKKTFDRPEGQEIEGRQIVRWSTELGGKSISGSDAVYRHLEAEEIARHGWPTNSNQARQRVRIMLRGLLAVGF